MSQSKEQSAQRRAVEPSVEPQVATADQGSAGRPVAGITTSPTLPGVSPAVQSSFGRGKTRQLGKRWWILAAGLALLLTMFAVAAVYLLTRKPSTVDQVIILTVPSGAEVKLNSKNYGHTPIKLEQLVAGTYTLTIEKENYEP